MKKVLYTWLAGFAFLLSSCGDSQEDLTEDMADVIEEVTEIVKGVNDGDDAKKAIDKINDLKSEVEEISKKSKEMAEDLSDEEKLEKGKEMMESDLGKKMMKTMGELTGELAKLPTSGTIGQADVAKAVADLMKAMQ